MSLSDAFNALLTIQSQTMTLKRDTLTATVKMAPSNFFRNLDGPANIVVDGREFVLSKKELDSTAFGMIKRGDKIISAESGTSMIDTIREMYDIGGKVIGYRIRTR